MRELRALSDAGGRVDKELKKLEERSERLSREIYGELTIWQRVQLSRHPDRPYFLDYLERLFEDFIELHGDRGFGDDPAVVSGFARFRWPLGGRDRPAEGAHGQAEAVAQLRHGAPRGLPQSLPHHGAGRALPAAGAHVHRHAGCLSGPRRRGARPERGHRRCAAHVVAAHGAGHRDGDRRGRLGRRARPRRGQPRVHARERHLQRDHTRGLRLDPVARRRARRPMPPSSSSCWPATSTSWESSTRCSRSRWGARTATSIAPRRWWATPSRARWPSLRRSRPAGLREQRYQKFRALGQFVE